MEVGEYAARVLSSSCWLQNKKVLTRLAKQTAYSSDTGSTTSQLQVTRTQPITINQSFLNQLQALCPLNGDPSKRVALVTDSMTRFDVSYFKNARDGQGVLESEQRLWEDGTTQNIVQNYAGNVRGLLGLRFNFDFPKAMVKMSSIGVKTGNQGEIRKICSKFN